MKGINLHKDTQLEESEDGSVSGRLSSDLELSKASGVADTVIGQHGDSAQHAPFSSYHHYGNTQNTTNVFQDPVTNISHAQNVNFWTVHYVSKRLLFAMTIFVGLLAFYIVRMHGDLAPGLLTLDIAHDLRLLDTLPANTDASGLRNEYLPNSRLEDEKVVYEWIEEPSSELVLWISAPAGMGKSTFACHLEVQLRSTNQLGASVFLGTLPTDTWGPETAIRLIAGEIGRIHHKAVPSIGKAILESHAMPLRTQMEKFIRDPILSLNLTSPLVIIVDGLDQWKSYHVFVEELGLLNSQSSLLRFIMFSRSEAQGAAFERVSVKPYQLQPISLAVMVEYFNQRFDLVEWDYGRKPSSEDVTRLASTAEGLFVWSATVCSLLEDSRSSLSPQDTLTSIVSRRLSVGESDSLAKLYSNAIALLFPNPEHQRTLMTFMGVTMVLQEPLPLTDFSSLIGIRPSAIRSLQADLKALQTWYPSDSGAVVYPASKLFHLSFIEYLQSASNTPSLPLPVSLKQAHEILGEATLQVLLRFLPTPQSLKSLYLSPLRKYAVKYWHLHLSKGTPFVEPGSDLDWKQTPSASTLQRTPIAVLRQWATLFFDRRKPGSGLQDTYKDDEVAALMQDVARALSGGEPSTIALQVSCLEIAVRLRPDNATHWYYLGKVLSVAAEHSRLPEHLNQAVAAHQNAAETWALPRGDPGRNIEESMLHYSLGAALYLRFKLMGNMDNLHQGISSQRKALELRPLGHPEHSTTLGKLTYYLGYRFEQTGRLGDLNEAISLCRETLARLPLDSPDRPIILNSLAITLLTCFRQIGCTSNLKDIIASYREALRLLPPDHPEASPALQGLAIALHSRFQRTSSIADLEEVIALERQTLDSRPEGHPDRCSALNNLAFSLSSRYEVQGAEADLEASIGFARASLALRPPGHPKRPYILDTLALSLRFRPEDLDESLDVINEALRITPLNHSNRIVRLLTLATILLARYHHFRKTAELEEATSTCEQVLASCPEHHFIRPKLLDLKDRLDREWAVLASSPIEAPND